MDVQSSVGSEASATEAGTSVRFFCILASTMFPANDSDALSDYGPKLFRVNDRRPCSGAGVVQCFGKSEDIEVSNVFFSSLPAASGLWPSGQQASFPLKKALFAGIAALGVANLFHRSDYPDTTSPTENPLK